MRDMKTLGVVLVVMLFFIKVSLGQVKSYFPEQSLNSVVLLEKELDNQFFPHGTGFLIYSYDSIQPMYVVTNEHVLRNQYIYVTLKADKELIDYMNSNKLKTITIQNTKWELYGEKIRHRFELIENKTYLADKELDIAVFKITIGTSVPLNDSTNLKISNAMGIPKSMIKFQKDIPLGTDTYFIGFPFSIGTELGYYNKNFTGAFAGNSPNPLVRNGSIAWISSNSNKFLLDAFSFSGNSGSPIFTKSDLQNSPFLIGIVSGHLPSERSENIGLATCTWIDSVIKLIEKF